MLGLHLGSVAIGALFGGVGVAWYFRRKTSSNTSGTSKLAGKIIPEVVGNPAPQNLTPRAGYRSRGDFEWAYLVGPGDTAASIAEAVTGDDGRYQELLLSNPDVAKIGTPGMFTGDAWDFAHALTTENLLFPLPWNRFVDELGNARGNREPFPVDPRATAEAPVAAADLPPPASPTAAPAKASGARAAFAPYGQPVMFGEGA
jgi:hypothetical protein